MPSSLAQPTLSVILITRNEAAHVLGCLKSVAFADEWIVVDSNSSDATCELARHFGATVTSTPDWPGFGAQKNRALALARGRWVLSIDADERVTPELAASIRAVIAADGAQAGHDVSRRSNFCSQWTRHGDWCPDRVLRLFRRHAGCVSNQLVHERPIVDGAIGRLQGELLHDRMPTLKGALDKTKRFSSGRSGDRVNAGECGPIGRPGGGLVARPVGLRPLLLAEAWAARWQARLRARGVGGRGHVLPLPEDGFARESAASAVRANGSISTSE